jgi:hypothetical protein
VSKGLEALLERRARLVQRAAVERDELAARLGRWSRPLALVDRGLTFVASLRKSAPLLGVSLGLGMAALAIARPRSIAGWLQGGIAAWKAVRSFSSLLRGRRRRVLRRA